MRLGLIYRILKNNINNNAGNNIISGIQEKVTVLIIKNKLIVKNNTLLYM
jgi:hypothetical protein